MTDPPLGAQHVFDRLLLGSVVDAAPDGVVIVDRQGTIRYWNQGSQRIFGFNAAEAVGSSLDVIIPERLRERHWEAFAAAISKGESRYGADDLLAVPARRSDGQRISIEFTVVLVPGEEGIRFVAAVIRDVTERRAGEMELRRRLAEIEGAESREAPASGSDRNP